MRRSYPVPLLVLLLCLLAGCIPASISKQLKKNVNEQLYIDARLAFSVKHPLDWQRLSIRVSSPQYRTDTVRWSIPAATGERSGEMLIRSRPQDPKLSAAEQLQEFLAERTKLLQQKMEEVALPAGKALRITGQDQHERHMTLSIKGNERDFIVSFACAPEQFETLQPTFEEIVSSFTEVADAQPPQPGQQQ